ncbi:MAG: hypothetical protein KJ767_00915 [Nanoarchaeota archaeon]|nr:hypothetical protein [Nanoarchaeota archaeon]
MGKKENLVEICESDLEGIEVNNEVIEESEKNYGTIDEIRNYEGREEKYSARNWNRCVWGQCVYRT